MKYYGLILSAISVLLMAGACSVKEDDPLALGGETQELVFTAESGEVDTKTAFQADETSIWWSPADEICIFYGASAGSKFTSSNDSEVAKAEFHGTLNAFTGESETGVANHFWAVYPYESAVSCDGVSVVAKISAQQTAKAGSFAPSTNLSIAKSTGLNLSFFNTCSWFRFSVTKAGIKSVTFRGNNNEDIAGTVKVAMDENGKPVVLEVLDGVKEIILKAPSGSTLEVGKMYYITLLPQTFTQGFTVTFKTLTQTGSRSITRESTYVRSKYNTGTSFDKDVVYSDIGGENDPNRITLNAYTKAIDGVIKGFNPDCNGLTRYTSVEEMNDRLYDYVGYSKDDFHALFTGGNSWTDYLGNPSDVRDTVVHCPDNTDPAWWYFNAIDCCGEVIENETTHVLTWKVWAEDIWDARYAHRVLEAYDMLPNSVSKDSLYHYVYYLNPTTGKTVVIRLAAAFDDFNTNIPTANFVPGYWKEEATAPNGVATEFNVAVPDATYPLNQDTLRSNLHSLFVKYPRTHPTAASQTYVDPGITDVNFFFDAVQIAKITSIGKYYATFKTNYTAAQVKADPDLNMDCLELYLVKFGPDKDHAITVNVNIAEIYNEAPEARAPRWSQVWYGGNNPEDAGLEFGYGGEDGPSYADSLLNTGVMYTYFGAWGEVCDDAARTFFISFGDAKASYFRGNFIRPINATTQSPVPFIDNATWTYPGSYINVKDLVDLYDWRGKKFSNEEGLWNYYGIDAIVVVTGNATTDGGFNIDGTLSDDIELVQFTAAKFTAKDANGNNIAANKAPYGYLTYRNIGASLNAEYHIWVPVKIRYDWGWYETTGEDLIKITVNPTE